MRPDVPRAQRYDAAASGTGQGARIREAVQLFFRLASNGDAPLSLLR